MRRAHGDVLAVQAKTILKGGLHLAVMANVLAANPSRDVSPMRANSRPKGATALTADELRGLLTKLRESEACQRHDLVDPITMFIATGLRISELLGLRWVDFEDATATLTVTGKVIRAAGQGLMRIDDTKTAAGRRTLPLPAFAATVLTARRGVPYFGEQTMIFPSTAGTWRDPDNFRARCVRCARTLACRTRRVIASARQWPPSSTTRGCPHGSVLTISVTAGSQ
jgi:integrase